MVDMILADGPGGRKRVWMVVGDWDNGGYDLS